MASILLTSLISGFSRGDQATGICLCVTGAKRGEREHCANATERSRARGLTHTFVAAIMHQKRAADTGTVFVGSVCVVKAAKSPTTVTTGSSVNAVISAVISTEDCSAEVWVTPRQPLLNNMSHIPRGDYISL